LDHQLIRDLIELQDETGMPAAGCSYAGILGTPALFHKSLFQELMQLKGDVGARKVLERMREDVGVMAFDHGAFDIDTPEDYQRLMNENNSAV
jgi:molybdenum cofactor cytidylyltransferase